MVDGENLSSAYACEVLAHVREWGDPCIRRVYGNASKKSGWETKAEFHLVNTGSGKNSADVLLCIEAVDLAHAGAADAFAIATSDQDFVHLARYLTARGIFVIGLGESKTPGRLRSECRQFVELGGALAPLDYQIHELIGTAGNGRSMPMKLFGTGMATRYQVRISERPEKTWRKYLAERPTLYVCDPKGPNARVHLKTANPAS